MLSVILIVKDNNNNKYIVAASFQAQECKQIKYNKSIQHIGNLRHSKVVSDSFTILLPLEPF